MAIPCDLSDLDAVDALVADVEKRLGGIDILINNAGRSIRRPLAESLERWHDVERTMALNYYSPLRLIRGLAPGMLERGDGHIINVSTWGVLSEASPLFAVYNASKAALSTVSRVVETEWGRQGCALDHAVLPAGGHPDDRADQGIPGAARADAGRGRRLDDHRRPHPAGADRAADGDRPQGAGHLRPPLGQCTHARAPTTSTNANNDGRLSCLISGPPLRPNAARSRRPRQLGARTMGYTVLCSG